jgi:hypothetical protein
MDVLSNTFFSPFFLPCTPPSSCAILFCCYFWSFAGLTAVAGKPDVSATLLLLESILLLASLMLLATLLSPVSVLILLVTLLLLASLLVLQPSFAGNMLWLTTLLFLAILLCWQA